MSHHFIATADGAQHYFSGRGAPTLQATAHSLACINRFNGHACRPYSVAEHLLLAFDIAQRELGVRNVGALLAVLMHDAHECIVGDMTYPLKLHLRWLQGGTRTVYDHVEDDAAIAIQIAYSIRTASTGWRDIIKHADLLALATERRDLMPPGTPPWPILEGVEPINWANLMDEHRVAMTWQDWRLAFTNQVEALIEARNGVDFPGVDIDAIHLKP